ncbi:uncharacterized protein LOC114528304 [Dendronephthya gigantea]|uniref:uncharacterized protein LOC114528304 n=1 Tax=Dendronephthya gigantea TaxID=151771 RepID=UPI00106A1FD0|nr:uncharacterized protein LOC114528304 [Dendronephthya gigantea]
MVREISVPASYSYIDEMCHELLYKCNKEDLKKTYETYKAKEPGSLTSQFSQRRSKEEAIRNQTQRKRKLTELFPSGDIQHQDQQKEMSKSASKQNRKAPCCRKCGQPMKGHQKSICESNTAGQQQNS